MFMVLTRPFHITSKIRILISACFGSISPSCDFRTSCLRMEYSIDLFYLPAYKQYNAHKHEVLVIFHSCMSRKEDKWMNYPLFKGHCSVTSPTVCAGHVTQGQFSVPTSILRKTTERSKVAIL